MRLARANKQTNANHNASSHGHINQATCTTKIFQDCHFIHCCIARFLHRCSVRFWFKHQLQPNTPKCRKKERERLQSREENEREREIEYVLRLTSMRSPRLQIQTLPLSNVVPKERPLCTVVHDKMPAVKKTRQTGCSVTCYGLASRRSQRRPCPIHVCSM